MVSDFITMDGYLCLTEEEYAAAKVHNPDITMGARQLLEYGEARNGYWTEDKFMKQMKKVVKVAETKYPKEKGYQLYWVFDQSGCHMWQSQVENEHYSSVSGLIRLVISLECFIEITPDFLCPFMND